MREIMGFRQWCPGLPANLVIANDMRLVCQLMPEVVAEDHLFRRSGCWEKVREEDEVRLRRDVY